MTFAAARFVRRKAGPPMPMDCLSPSSLPPYVGLVTDVVLTHIHVDHTVGGTLRRFVPSLRFVKRFGRLSLSEEFSASDAIGRAIPLVGRKMSRPQRVVIKDRNGVRHECIVEGFTQTHQVFLLVCPVASLTAASIVVPSLPAG
jgi:hypothetical protein